MSAESQPQPAPKTGKPERRIGVATKAIDFCQGEIVLCRLLIARLLLERVQLDVALVALGDRSREAVDRVGAEGFVFLAFERRVLRVEA